MYSFYIGGELLPLPPEKMTMKIKGTNKTMTLINEGEVNFLRTPGLTNIDFDVLLPNISYSFASYSGGYKPAKYFLNHLENLMTDKKPFQFVIARRKPDGNLLFDNDIKCSLENYSTTENVNEGFDVKVTISLKQYKDFGSKIVKVVENKVSTETKRETANSPEPKKEQTYTVKSGDCLWNISKKYYGDGSKYTVIYNANKDKITNPNVISVGQVLTIPSA